MATVNHPAETAVVQDTNGTTDNESTTQDLSTLTREPSIAEKVRQARDEGHDADVPSSLGYVLPDADEKRGRDSLASARRQSQATNRSLKATTNDPESHPAESPDANGDENVVWWDGDSDLQNPCNWASWRKVLNVVLVSALTFVTPLASCKHQQLGTPLHERMLIGGTCSDVRTRRPRAATGVRDYE